MRRGLGNSTSLRLSIILVTIYFLAYALTGLLLWVEGFNRTVDNVSQSLIEEIETLESNADKSGIEPIISHIEFNPERLGGIEYWLASPEGIPIAGRYPELAGPIGSNVIRRDMTTSAKGEDWLVLTEPIASGDFLSVAKSLTYARQPWNDFIKQLGIIGGIIGIIAFYTGIIVSRHILERIDRLHQTLKAAGEGDLAARYRVTTREDQTDIGEIGIGVNTLLTQIEGLVSSIRRVTSDVAHDLRTPLSQLQNNLDKIKNAKSKANRDQYIKSSQSKVTDILRGFDAILRLGEIESGQAAKNFQPVDISVLSEKVLSAYGPDIEVSGRTSSAKLSPECMVEGNEALLFQAFSNLVENAIKHTPKGAHIAIQTFTNSRTSVLSVTDNGPGISEDFRDEMLKPFYRMDKNRSLPGSGLGLSIVAAIAKVHDAALVLSDHSPGLSVQIHFPIKAN